jgi:oligopeptide transport system substrate-binding protein
MEASYRCSTHKIHGFVLLAVLLAWAAFVIGCGGGGEGAEPKGGVLRMAITAEPVVDPAKAADVGSATLAIALFDPLVKLGPDLQPVPNLARSWDITPDGLTVTFHLRPDSKWSNGDAVTAQDFEYSWKRALSAEVGGGFAYQLFGIAGAPRYATCKSACEALQDRVGVRALDDRTLQVRLSSPQPWFVAQAAHWAFLPVHRATVEKFGDAWSEANHIVTNGPYRLATWKHNASVTLVKNPAWRDADDVAVNRVELTVIPDPAAQLEAFESGKVDALDGAAGTQFPKSEIARLQETGNLAVYAGIGTFYLGINIAAIPDAAQRRAMALAIDRTALAARLAGAGVPATSFTPVGMPGYDTIAPRFLDSRSRLTEARTLLKQVKNPKRRITLYENDHDLSIKQTLGQVQEDWSKIGISTTVELLEWASFLEKLGPPAGRNVDVYALGWVGDYPDDTNFLSLWTCNNENNSTGYCNRRFDQLIAHAPHVQNTQKRWKIYAELEDRLTGSAGDFPIIPVNWYAFVNLERQSVRKTFNIVPLFGYADLSKVVMEPR